MVIVRTIRALTWTALALLLVAGSACAADHGKLAGVVVDPAGTPQVGATVWVASEEALSSNPAQLLTNYRGVFSNENLLPGLYTVRVTMAGFLPSLEQHIRVRPNLTTLVRIELDSVFASLDRLRRQPRPATDDDEWTWVLRTSAATRPVLRWADGEIVIDAEMASGETARRRKGSGRIELTSGARRPGSVANLADAAASAFAYEQAIGRRSRLVFAGQMSYERAAGGSFATVWLPAGEPGKGSQTTLVLRQSSLGPSGPAFRGVRMEHSDQLSLGDRLSLHYSAEYVLVGLGRSTSALRPRAELTAALTPNWHVSLLLAAQPAFNNDPNAGALQSALAALDAFPALLLRNGRPVMENGWHQEVAVERRLSSRSSLILAGFHDRLGHQAIAGRGSSAEPDVLRDFYSSGFLYDGGGSGSWGTRAAFRQKFSGDLELLAVYAWAGGLVLRENEMTGVLRDAFENRGRHSLAARVSAKMPRFGTRVVASYKWVNGAAVSRVDRFGESLFQLDPNLNFTVRQPLPSFVAGTHFEALADFGNLLAQGYVPVSTSDGRLILAPAFRSFRGGVSLQF